MVFPWGGILLHRHSGRHDDDHDNDPGDDSGFYDDHGKEENGDGCVNGQYQHHPALG